MDKDKFERLNYLTEKAFLNVATPDEIKEFNQLHEQWIQPQEYNLFSDYDDEH